MFSADYKLRQSELWLTSFLLSSFWSGGTIDSNKNGIIDKKDFDMALEKTASNRKLTVGDVKHKEVQESLAYVWEHLKKVADRDNDGTVSTEEWLKMWDEAISEQQNPPWVSRYQSFLFEAEDVTGDGKVDLGEYTTAYTSYGVSEEECKNAFKKLTNVSLLNTIVTLINNSTNTT